MAKALSSKKCTLRDEIESRLKRRAIARVTDLTYLMVVTVNRKH